MNPEQLLETLRHPDTVIPRATFAEIVGRPEEFVPLLLAEIEKATRLGADADLDDSLPSLALYLLAELREPRALEPILTFFALDGTTDEDIFGDVIVQDGPRILAGVAQDRPEVLREYARRRDISAWVRGATFDALVSQCLWGEQPRESVAAYFRELIETRAFGKDTDSWSMLVNACLDLHPREFLEPIRHLYERELVDFDLAGDFDEVEEEAAEDPEAHRLYQLTSHAPITDTSEAIAWWSLFADPASLDDDDDDEDWGDDLLPPPADVPAVPIRTSPKIGRNDLCPCGSGKKYKKCCLPASQ